MIYGLYDTEDNVWLGDEKGPMLFDSETDPLPGEQGRKVRAMMCDAQLTWRAGRTEGREWRPAEVTKRDTVDIKRDALTALTMLEEGRL